MSASGDSLASDFPELLTRHLAQLRDGSGIADAVIRERGYRSIINPHDLEPFGFPQSQRRPGLLLPIWAPDGKNGRYQLRSDSPRPLKGKVVKYENPATLASCIDVPPRCQSLMLDASVPLWITEGTKKADAGASHGLCMLALPGVWGFKSGGVWSVEWDLVQLRGREVRIVFDSDVTTKGDVRQALDRLTKHLERQGATYSVVFLPPGEGGAKVGLDDFLLTHSVAELEALVGRPEPKLQVPPPLVEILDDGPPSLTRPLQIVDGRAYCATWLWTKTTVSQTVNAKSGEIVIHKPPLVQTELRQFVVRDDGVLFGDRGDKPFEDAGIEIKLPDAPPDDKLWRSPSVKLYRAGRRPSASDAFRRVTSVFNHFIDFGHSLADQMTMCELSTCFSLATWFAPAFTVLGYPWPNGEKGSGKTNWGLVWVATSYLGQALTMGGSFAAIRDLADYGAALLFDDAETLNDPKRTDPDKRALLLAGNRKGIRIPLKEPVGDKWVTRWVNAYGPRGFTAIELPDNVLASRSIVLPLVRTNDPQRGNADPSDMNAWPCDQRALQDDLWGLTLSLLRDAEAIWSELSSETTIVGREFEPWRALVAVARLLERHGVEGLEARICGVMRAYLKERSGILGDDWSVALIKALVELSKGRLTDTSDASVTSDTCFEEWVVTASDIAQEIKVQGAADDANTDWATPTKVGQLLAHFRFKKATRSGKKGSRGWVVATTHVAGLARAYGVSDASDVSEVSEGDSEDGSEIDLEALTDGEWDALVESDLARYGQFCSDRSYATPRRSR